MTDFYNKLMEQSGFDEALIRHAHEFTDTIDINEFSRLFFDTQHFSVEKAGVLSFEDSFYPYDFYSLLQCLGKPSETSALYIYIVLSERSCKEHISRKLDEKIFFDTMKSVAHASKIYSDNTGHEGLYDYHFLANHIRGNILRLGSFEYQYGSFEDKKAIILHVPENANMEKEKRLHSYSLARRFFGDFPIIADSWLLFNEHKKMLPEDSRILDFMNDFDIVSSHETTDYSELFHVFGRLSDFSYKNLPKSTALQRAYAERVRNNLPIGSATGVLRH